MHEVYGLHFLSAQNMEIACPIHVLELLWNHAEISKYILKYICKINAICI